MVPDLRTATRLTKPTRLFSWDFHARVARKGIWSSATLCDKKTRVKYVPTDDLLDVLATSLENAPKRREKEQSTASRATGSFTRTGEPRQGRKQRTASNTTRSWSKTSELRQLERRQSTARKAASSSFRARKPKQQVERQSTVSKAAGLPLKTRESKQREKNESTPMTVIYSSSRTSEPKKRERRESTATQASGSSFRTSKPKQGRNQSTPSDATSSSLRTSRLKKREMNQSTRSSRISEPKQQKNKYSKPSKATHPPSRASKQSPDVNRVSIDNHPPSTISPISSPPEEGGLYTLSLKTDEAHQTALDAVRHVYFPGHEDQPPPYMAVFRNLPASQLGQIRKDLDELCQQQKVFDINVARPFRLKQSAGIRMATGERQSTAIFDRLRSQWKWFLSGTDDKSLKKHYTILDVVDDKEESKTFLEQVKKGVQGSRGLVEGLSLWRFEKGEMKYQRFWNFQPRERKWKPPKHRSLGRAPEYVP